MSRNCGIYQILNKQTGKRYIGSSKDIVNRWKIHRWHLSTGKHHAITLQRSYDRRGPDAFEYSVLLYCDQDNLLMYEQALLDGLKPFGRGGYNISKFAGSPKGVVLSPEAAAAKKAKMRRTRGTVVWNGEPTTLTAVSEQFGLRPDAISSRMKSGWTFERAVSTPIGVKNVTYDGMGKRMTSVEWAKLAGVSKAHAHKVLKNGGRPEDLMRRDKLISVHELAKSLGLSGVTVHSRISQGWQLIDALSVPAVRTGYAHEVELINPRKVRKCYVF